LGDPWLAIVGMTDDSATGLPPASRAVLDGAEVIFGGPRHLDRAGAGDRGQAWDIPFDIAPVLALRGRRVAVLASGDPFWFGAGSTLAAALQPGEWRSYPAPSTFALAANALGWRLEEITCHGLHAAPVARLRGVLAPNARLICLLRDGAAPAELAHWLCGQGAGAARLHVLERLGGPDQRMRASVAESFNLTDIAAPVAVAVELPGNVGLSRASGLPDDSFAHDGQITRRAVRALTLSALAPRPGEMLWDIGAGSGSVSVEWCLAGGRAVAVEKRADRCANIARNIEDFGLSHRMSLVEGDAAGQLDDLPEPDAVFVGGGGGAALWEAMLTRLAPGTRIVANAVTLDGESRLMALQAKHGGTLLRIDLASSEPLGSLRGWQPGRPIVQWSGAV
jgi:precorrin-6B C5,15-methyltransferase / cobalt-precorrin-6B C5,C15-methyltransferase